MHRIELAELVRVELSGVVHGVLIELRGIGSEGGWASSGKPVGDEAHVLGKTHLGIWHVHEVVVSIERHRDLGVVHAWLTLRRR